MLKPKPQAPASAAASPKEAARALLSMLGEGAPADGRLPDAQMRLLARDLIAQVEGRTPPAKPPEPEPAPERRRKLFSRIRPLAPGPETEAPLPSADPDPVEQVSEPPRTRAPEPPGLPPSEPPRARARDPIRGHSDREAAPPDLPTSFAIPARRTRRAAPPAILPLGQVQKLALQGIKLGEIEHPAILALALRGRPPLEQAVALRALPRGQARAVHRALRMMENRT